MTPSADRKPRECWALYHIGTGEFIRAIDSEPDEHMIKTMPIEYAHMVEVTPEAPMDEQTAEDITLIENECAPYFCADEKQAWNRIRARLTQSKGGIDK